jgi:hypothetical protein
VFGGAPFDQRNLRNDLGACVVGLRVLTGHVVRGLVVLSACNGVLLVRCRVVSRFFSVRVDFVRGVLVGLHACFVGEFARLVVRLLCHGGSCHQHQRHQSRPCPSRP